MTAFRCAAASAAREERLVGTASTVRAFVLVECPVRWGRDILRDAPLPSAVREQLTELTRLGVKVLLIRSPWHRLRVVDGVRVFAAYADPVQPWLETSVLGALDDVADLDLASVAAGESVGLPRTEERLVCVCTHGRHDVCCAELGRPIAKALRGTHPELTWEVSHIGGDRFAGNLLLLPHGLYYGRVTSEQAPLVVAEYLAGRMELEHLRGRSSRPTAVQAAEWHLRHQLNETSLDAVTMSQAQREGTDWAIVFRRGEEAWQVAVRMVRQEAAQLTCRAAHHNAAPAYELITISRVT